MEENISITLKNASEFVPVEEIAALAGRSVRHLDRINDGTGQGSDFLGWLNLPEDVEPQLDRIEKTASRLREISDATVVIGIGGSYLGTRAVTDALTHSFSSRLKKKSHELLYAGQNMAEDYLSELIDLLDETDYSIIAISKSGTTTESAIGLRFLKDHLEKKAGAKTSERIVAITDSSRGALRTMADKNGYETFIIPDNIGGRYSVLSPVGLLPVAVRGLDIREIIRGAKSMEKITRHNREAASNPALLYAAARNLILGTGRTTEILVDFTPKLHYFAEWWKQLFGESEGKDGRGIFPASVDFTTDLHSLGQYIQEGQRIIFETMLSVTEPGRELVIPKEKEDLDQLNYLSGRRLSEVNHKAELGTTLAHNDGSVPILTITIPRLNEFYIGQMIYFFETACALSGYILDINPFDQPGVEAYKKNMFALLEKPGYEEAGKKLRERLK